MYSLWGSRRTRQSPFTSVIGIAYPPVSTFAMRCPCGGRSLNSPATAGRNAALSALFACQLASTSTSPRAFSPRKCPSRPGRRQSGQKRDLSGVALQATSLQYRRLRQNWRRFETNGDWRSANSRRMKPANPGCACSPGHHRRVWPKDSHTRRSATRLCRLRSPLFVQVRCEQHLPAPAYGAA